MRIAFVEPYFGGSHRSFAEGFASASAHDVTLLTHPSSFWKWRMQGGFLTLADAFERAVDADGPFDVVMASSMLDLARFAGACRGSIGPAPLVLYMHENQLTYPTAPADEFDATYAITNWAAMTVADLILFNSDFHRDEWFGRLPVLLGSLPDHRHTRRIDAVRDRSGVAPVGIDLTRLDAIERRRGERALVLWNHRWEHDRGPDLFADAILAAAERGAEFDVGIAGERFVNDPTGFDHVARRLGERVVQYGFATEPEYSQLLRSADVVVSTSRQEFFGISIVEAIYAGAFPLLPDRLVYPERIPVRFHPDCLYRDGEDLVDKLVSASGDRDRIASVAAALRPEVELFDWSIVGPELDRRLERLVDRAGRGTSP